MDISIIKDYIPLVTTIFAALLTYFLGFRKGKQDKFNTQIEESLQVILSPMLHEIKIIIHEESAFQRQKLLKEFFYKYSKEDTKLFKMPSKFIHDYYYRTQELFFKFEKDKNKDDWDTFWVYFHKLSKMVNDEYNTIRENIYSDYKWLIDLSKKNCFVRITFEFLTLIYDAIKFIIRIDFILIIGIIINNVQGEKLVPMYINQMVSISLVISLLLYGLLLMILADYSSAKHMQKESAFKKIKNKILPEKLRKIIDIDIEKEKKKIIIPDMYNE